MDDRPYIILTGGAGFIGSAVLRSLNNEGIKKVVVVDQLGKTEKWKNLVGKQFADCIHKDALFDWLQGKEREIHALIHLGACSSTLETDAHYLLENNYRYSVRLAQYALNHGHRFIYASSAATYGDGSQGFSDHHDRLDLLEPLNMYGYSKHLFDLWLKENNCLNQVVGLKYFNVYGPNEYHKGRMCSALVKMVSDVLKMGTISLFKSTEPEKYKDGNQVRDFIYVKDVAKMTTQFLNNQVTGIFNIGMGTPHTWNHLAQAVFKALYKEEHIDYIDVPQDLVGKYQNYTCADMEKYKKSNLLSPSYPWEESIIDYVRNYLLLGKYW